MNRMLKGFATSFAAAVCLLAASAAPGAEQGAAKTPPWTTLFNGRNLDGWSVHYASPTPSGAPPAASLFDVHNGVIHAYRDEQAGTEQPNAFIVTDREYRDYKLSLEYRWGDKKFPPRAQLVRDSGLLYHVHRLRPADWPASTESQIQEGDTGDTWAVSSQATSTIHPQTRRFALPENGGVPVTVGHDGKFERIRHGKVNEYPGWNTLEIIVRGDSAVHIVNGVVNMRVSDLKAWDAAGSRWIKLDHGRIALQAESAEVFFRNIKLRPLSKEDAAAPQPRTTELWFPVPPKVTPGARHGAAPSDAVVLFDGRNLDAWQSAANGNAAPWKIVDGELVIAPGTGDILTKQSFGDVQLHVEWRTPALPADKVNQDRGNSGIFLQDVYEVQILDNFENQTYVNGQAASIYKQYPPLVNATLPAEAWQTYDIIFTAPRFAADGALLTPAHVTVLHNGVLVQNHVALRGGTTYIGAPSYRPHGDAPIRLQDHSHEVRFRNIWLRKF